MIGMQVTPSRDSEPITSTKQRALDNSTGTQHRKQADHPRESAVGNMAGHPHQGADRLTKLPRRE